MNNIDAIRQQRLSALEQMLKDQPEDTFALYGLAVEYRQLDRLAEAEGLLRRVLVIDAQQFYTYYQLGELLMGQGRRDEAREVIEEGQRRASAAGHTKAAAELSALARGL
ncbi:hypothetical protein KKF91_13395 [Myxococcota bacterium]|nr:hypothetical protein [Myxococcota bacterium]MBU1431531.1 hypothetical protein [Myxococcota bacterium]MBU1899628.1 hypothetical protein [Myxococcota bacterium]